MDDEQISFKKRALNALQSPFRIGRSRFAQLKVDTQGWIICAAVLCVTVVRSNVTYSFGEFVTVLEHHNKINNASLTMAMQNWIGTLSFTVSLSFSPISVLFIRHVGQNGYQIAGISGVIILSVSCLLSSLVCEIKEEWMFFTHSFLYGVGSSLLYMASSLVIGEYFDKTHRKHVLATSILLCGYPVGSLIFNPINGWLVDRHGVVVAFRVAGILVFLTGLPCASLFVPRIEHQVETVNYGDYRRRMMACCVPSMFVMRPEILLWLLGNMMTFIVFNMPFVNLPYYMTETKKSLDINIARSAWTMTWLSLAECITYIIAASVGDHFKGRLVYINLISSSGLMCIFFTWPFVDVNYYAIIGLAIGLGGFLGMAIVFQYAASAEVTKLPVDVAWSSTNMWSGFGILVGPLFTGVIYDIRKNYDDVFNVCGAICVLQMIYFGGIIAVQLRRRWSCKDYNELQGEDATDDSNKASRANEEFTASWINGDVDAAVEIPSLLPKEYIGTFSPQVSNNRNEKTNIDRAVISRVNQTFPPRPPAPTFKLD